MLGFISGVNIGSAVRAAGRAVLGAPQAWPRCQAPQAMPFKGGYWPRRRSKACDLAKPAQNHRRRPLPAKSRWARSPLKVSNWAGSSASSRETGPDLARHFLIRHAPGPNALRSPEKTNAPAHQANLLAPRPAQLPNPHGRPSKPRRHARFSAIAAFSKSAFPLFGRRARGPSPAPSTGYGRSER